MSYNFQNNPTLFPRASLSGEQIALKFKLFQIYVLQTLREISCLVVPEPLHLDLELKMTATLEGISKEVEKHEYKRRGGWPYMGELRGGMDNKVLQKAITHRGARLMMMGRENAKFTRKGTEKSTNNKENGMLPLLLLFRDLIKSNTSSSPKPANHPQQREGVKAGEGAIDGQDQSVG